MPPTVVLRRQTAAAAESCVHLYEYQKGGRRCRFCGDPPPYQRARHAGAPARRECPPEKDVQRDVIQLLVAVGCRYSAKHETDIYVLGTRRPRSLPGLGHHTFQTPGISDLWVFLPAPRCPRPGMLLAPRAVWIEVKAEDGRPSDAQIRFQQQCCDRGIAHVTGGVAEVQAFLIQHGFLKEQ
jgi:hypothetical protein